MRSVGLLVVGVLCMCAPPVCTGAEPAFPVPERPLAFELEAPLAPLAVAGLDIVCPDGSLLSAPLRLREDGIWTLRVHCRRTDAAGRMPLALSAVLDSGGPVREVKMPLTEDGGIAPETVEMPLHLEPGQGSGESVLRISACRTGKTGADLIASWPLAVMPAFVEPVPAPSALDKTRVAEVYGKRAVLLDARFRLGKGAVMELAIPPALAGVPIGAMGIVSSLAWLPRQDRDKTGLDMATVEAVAPAGEERFSLRLGIDTLQVDRRDFAKDGSAERERVRTFSTWTQESGGKVLTRENYAALCPLRAPTALKSVRLSHGGTGAVVQVDGVVLVPAN